MKILIDIDCDPECCWECELLETVRQYCMVFNQWIDNDMRCEECLEAESDVKS